MKRENLTLLQHSESLEREEGWKKGQVLLGYHGSGEKYLRAFVFGPGFLLWCQRFS